MSDNQNKLNDNTNNKNVNEKNNEIILDFFGFENKQPEEKLNIFFNNKKIYLDLYNGEENINHIYYNILSKYKIIHCKKLTKNIDYIIFKDGHLKTQKFAILNGIKIVNPLWVDDKINKNIYKNDKEYGINVNYDNIILKEKIDKLEKEEKINNKKNKSNKKQINYDVELEDEFDYIYANYIDKERSKTNLSNSSTKNTNKYNNIDNFNNLSNNSKIIVGREKRKNIQNKNKNKKNELKNKPKKKSKELTKQKIININNNKITLDILDNINNNKNNDRNTINLDNQNYNKINIFSFNLEKKEIEILKNSILFVYKGELKEKLSINDTIYNETKYIILELENTKYNWEIYKFLFDKKIIIEFTSFLLEFINEENININEEGNKEIITKLNNISLNNEIYFLNNKKIKKINLINNNELSNNNDFKNRIKFIISKLLDSDEIKILTKLLKNYLKGNIINDNNTKKRSKSSDNYNNQIISFFQKCDQTQIKKSKKIKNEKKNNIDNNKNKMNINIDIKKIKDSKYSNNIYLIANQKTLIEILKLKENYKGIISPSYIYDSFFNGEFLNLEDINIFNKYKLI